MYSTGIAYFLWLIGGFGALGLHRFYLGKFGTGILYLCTGGVCMIGSVYDFFTLSNQVREANIRAQIRDAMDLKPLGRFPRQAEDEGRRRKESIEHAILRAAKKNSGIVTPSDIALEAEVSLEEAKTQLERLAKNGFAEMRIRKSGVIVYCFPDFLVDRNASEFEAL